MKTIPVRLRVGVLALLSVALGASTSAAQDVDAMAKWTALTVVHYKVVGEHTGNAPLLVLKSIRRDAQVTDRVEFELDWNQQEFKLVGTPVVRNFPSKLGAVVPVTNCPLPKVDGAFELLTLQAVKGDGPMAMSGIMTLQGKKDLPAGAIPTMNEYGCQEWQAIQARSETFELNFQLPPAMSLAMGGAPYTLSPDGKSLVFKASGWQWTVTPTPGK